MDLFDTTHINNILIVRLSAIGDCLQASPVAQKLRERFPNAYISWVVETKSKDAVIGNPYIDEAIVFEREEWMKEAGQTKDYRTLFLRLKTFFAGLKSKKFDIALDFQGLLKSALVSYFSGAPVRVCYRDTKELSTFFANKLITPEYALDIHKQQRYAGMLRFLGIDTENLKMYMPYTATDREYAHQFITENGLEDKRFMILNPSTSWPSKCWPQEYYAALGDKLVSELKIPVVITGAPADKPITLGIAKAMRQPAIDAAGKTTLPQLGAMAAQARLFISGDTGPLYIAEAVGVPTLSMWGPTNPVHMGPRGNRHVVLTAENCRFCRKRKCDHISCLREITPDKVFAKTVEMLNSD